MENEIIEKKQKQKAESLNTTYVEKLSEKKRFRVDASTAICDSLALFSFFDQNIRYALRTFTTKQAQYELQYDVKSVDKWLWFQDQGYTSLHFKRCISKVILDVIGIHGLILLIEDYLKPVGTSSIPFDPVNKYLEVRELLEKNCWIDTLWKETICHEIHLSDPDFQFSNLNGTIATTYVRAETEFVYVKAHGFCKKSDQKSIIVPFHKTDLYRYNGIKSLSARLRLSSSQMVFKIETDYCCHKFCEKKRKGHRCSGCALFYCDQHWYSVSTEKDDIEICPDCDIIEAYWKYRND